MMTPRSRKNRKKSPGDLSPHLKEILDLLESGDFTIPTKKRNRLQRYRGSNPGIFAAGFDRMNTFESWEEGECVIVPSLDGILRIMKKDGSIVEEIVLATEKMESMTPNEIDRIVEGLIADCESTRPTQVEETDGLKRFEDETNSHKEIIDELERTKPPGYLKVLMDYVENVELENWEGEFYLLNTSLESFDAALDIVLKHDRQKVSILYDLLDTVMQGNRRDSLERYFLDKLIEVDGVNAVESLADYIEFSTISSSRLTDDRVASALLSFGPSISEKLAENIIDSWNWLNWSVIDVLLKFGIKGKKAIMNKIAEDFDSGSLGYGSWNEQYNETIDLFEKAFDKSIPSWPKALLQVIRSLDIGEYSDHHNLAYWIGKPDVDIPTKVLVEALNGNDDVLRIGACIYLDYRPRDSKIIINTLENLITTTRKRPVYYSQYHPIRALSRIAKRKHLQMLLDKIAPLKFYDVDIIISALTAFRRHGKYGVRLLKVGSERKKKSVKNASLLLIGLLATKEDMTQALISEGFEWLVTMMSNEDLDEKTLQSSSLSVVSKDLLKILSYLEAEKEIRIVDVQSRVSFETMRKKREDAIAGERKRREARLAEKDEPSYYI